MDVKMNVKKDVGDRPWENEPNRLEFTAHGLQCLIMRHSELGHLCGYVGVNRSHPTYGLFYDSYGNLARLSIQRKLGDIKVHGGLTFAERGNGKEWAADLWWFGFDCAHSDDYCPKLHLSQSDAVYRDINYVRAETEKLAKQLASIRYPLIDRILDRLCAALFKRQSGTE